jgi:mono/diheme cytochrome c family protein
MPIRTTCSHRTPAPRNDIARRITWNLEKHAGKQVFLELVDGDTAGAYAWLAVGRFEPAVVSLPKITPKLVDDRVQAAAQIALAVRDNSLEPQLGAALKMPAGADARGAIASTLLALNSRAHLAACGDILADLNEPLALRQRVAQAISESNTDDGRTLLLETIRQSSERSQSKIAAALASTKPGAEALLREVETGKLSARVLQDRAVKEKIAAAKPANAQERLAQATKNLVPLNEQVQKTINERAANFKAITASAARGLAAFEKNCAACHQIDGKGAVIGPQLDGIGTRGAERIMEDILDPTATWTRRFARRCSS